jgi:peptidoglycan hydrolase-like protein with peptidoglycan-binding domain
MTRKLALIAGILFSSVSAGSLLAQTAAPPKPVTKSSSMQHAPAAAPTPAANQDSTTVWTKEQISEAQAGLAKAGYYKGQPTGKFDHRTRSALEAYQKANKQPVTGRLTKAELDKLHSS